MELDKVLDEIWDAYIDADREPSDEVIDVLRTLAGHGSLNEWRKYIGKRARSRGSNLLAPHYPAFGQPGCEFLAKS
jgi:hypothetical protein